MENKNMSKLKQNGWKKTTLGDIINVIGGGTPNRSIPKYWGGSIPWLSVPDFNNEYRTVDSAKESITELGLKKSSTKILETGQLIISARGTVGALAQLANPMAFNQSNYGIDAKPNYATNDFLYYLIRYSIHSIKSMTHGAVFDTIIRETFNHIKVNLPPLPEQKAIGSVLSSFDDKIDLLHRQNKTLENMAQTLFQQWFIEPCKNKLPKGWKEGKLGDFIKPQKGKNITKSSVIEGEYPVIAGGLKPSCYHNKFNTKYPVVTVSASGANAGYVNIYYTPVWSSDSSYIDSTITQFVYFYYIFLKLNQRLISDKQEGSVQPHIYPSHLMELEMFEYPITIIKNYEKIATGFFQRISYNCNQIRTLEKLRDTLLPKLMSGKVQVSLE